MTLIEYLSACKERPADMARSLGIARAYLHQMASGRRSVPPRMVQKIKSLTCGQVSESDLRPDDWQEIWPELAVTDKISKKKPAPALTNQAQAAITNGGCNAVS